MAKQHRAGARIRFEDTSARVESGLRTYLIAILGPVRVALQMLIGFALIVRLGVFVAYHWPWSLPPNQITPSPSPGEVRPTYAGTLFDMGGQFLAASSLVELGWLLFTPGPDEAIEPIVLGLAAAALTLAGQVTDNGTNGMEILGLAMVVTLLVGVLLLRNRLLDSVVEREQAKRK